jgi:aryl-alcohol dehydrogenase-like predicted oxidoreductase
MADDPLLSDPQLAALAGLIPRTPGPDEPAAPAKILPILAREPLAGGALAGTIGPGMKLAPRDERHALDAKALETIAIAIAKLAKLVRDEPPAARSCEAALSILEQSKRPDHVEAKTMPELALRYVLDRGALALPRLHRHEYVTPAIVSLVATPLSVFVTERILDALP